MKDIIDLANNNSGFLGLLLFVLTLFISWVSGLFKHIKKRPKFKIRIIENATFGCIIDLYRTHKNLPVNKTAFAIYIEVTNIGNAPSSIGKINLGYLLSDMKPKWRTSRKWIVETISKSDFRVEFKGSDKLRVFPFLKQANEFQRNVDTYLEVGKSVSGIVYFEQNEAFGSWMPRLNKDLKTSDLIIKIEDAFGRCHKKKFTIELVDPNYSLKFSPYFGQTQHEYFINKKDNKNGILESDTNKT
ncbi:MAG: hypothetical protein COB98_06790 [Flavobacteriaceae bacterium]|nr:MAG: hypothetical protein COB98_06790 [Flavobacteriaceae bacterium]